MFYKDACMFATLFISASLCAAEITVENDTSCRLDRSLTGVESAETALTSDKTIAANSSSVVTYNVDEFFDLYYYVTCNDKLVDKLNFHNFGDSWGATLNKSSEVYIFNHTGWFAGSGIDKKHGPDDRIILKDVKSGVWYEVYSCFVSINFIFCDS